MGDIMNKKRIVASALAVSAVLAACAAEDANEKTGEEVSDWGDPDKYPNIGGAFASLAALNGTCAYDANKVVTITSAGAQTILVGKRAVDSALLVNGAACTTAGVTATTKDVKKIVINGHSASADEVVILDFLGGLYAAATATAGAGGIEVNLGDGTGDDLRIRGQSVKDAFYMGSDDSISFNSDNYKDITLSGVEKVSVALATGDDIFSGTNPVTIRGILGSTTIPLKISGGAGADVLTGGGGQDTLWGGPGNDILNGGLDVDIAYGEGDNDTFKAGDDTDGDDFFIGGSETDTVSYEARTQVITASVGVSGGMVGETDTYTTCENLTGGAGADTLTGKAGEANVIRGGEGNDTITGLTGNDSLYGDDGDDTFDEVNYTKGAGNDIIDGGDGTDLVDYSARSGALTVTMDGKTADDGESGETDNVAANVENLKGGTGVNTITGNALANEITGGAAADVLSGGDGNDTLWGKALGDTLNGGNGDDTFKEDDAANGGDTFNGGLGIDLVDYSARTTSVVVTMSSNVANDGATGENDNVKDDVEDINGGTVADTITGNASDNKINGGAGDDFLYGLAGDDIIDGETDNATIDCGDGDDIAFGITGSAVACEL